MEKIIKTTKMKTLLTDLLLTVAFAFTVSTVGNVALLAQFGGGNGTAAVLQSQDEGKKIETSTTTETRFPDGRIITTTTHTPTVNVDASFGIKVNANMSNFIIRDMPDNQSNMGFGWSAGIFLKLENKEIKNFAFQYDLLLHYKSSKMENEIEQTETDYQHYGLELSIYFMGQINAGSGKFFIGAGPFLNIGLDAIRNPGNIDLYRKDKATNKSEMHRWDFGLGAIVGYEFRNGISINCVYKVGLINLLSADKDIMTMKNRTISFGIGYQF